MEWYQIVLIAIGSAVLWFVLSAVLYVRLFKRVYDFFLSLITLVVFLPLLLLLTLIGSLEMKGNPFFVQPRPGKIGKDGEERVFYLIKFRTMTNAKDKDGRLLPDEKRLTRYGSFLRKTSLDELPEILNILCGKMSFVGPRPQLVRDMVFMTEEQRKRHTVRPGLTGLAQIHGRNAVSWDEKLEWDLRYIAHITFVGDLKLLFKTVTVALLRHEGITDGEHATALDLGDWLLKNGRITPEFYDEKTAEAKNKLENDGTAR